MKIFLVYIGFHIPFSRSIEYQQSEFYYLIYNDPLHTPI